MSQGIIGARPMSRVAMQRVGKGCTTGERATSRSNRRVGHACMVRRAG